MNLWCDSNGDTVAIVICAIYIMVVYVGAYPHDNSGCVVNSIDMVPCQHGFHRIGLKTLSWLLFLS